MKAFALKSTLITLGVAGLIPPVHAQERPNIVLINIDDLGWTDNSYTSKYYETPNLEKLKSRGMYFPNAYAGAANSAPSRASLMTGQYTPFHGIYTVNPPDRGNAEDRALQVCPNEESLQEGNMNLALKLKQAGYETCHVGKWHLGKNPLEQGMDINIGGNQKGHPSTYFSPYSNPNLKDGPPGEYLTDRLTSEAIQYLCKQDNKKAFFLYFAPYAVHTPLQAPIQLIEKYKNKTTTEAHRNPVYAAMVENMDDNLGRLIHALDSLNLADNTFIVITSDNGGVYNISKQWPLRAGKGSFYEGGIRIPLILLQPVRVLSRQVDDLVSHLDIYPTIMEMIGQSTDGLAGVSLLPLFSGRKIPKRALFWHFPAYLEGGNKESKDTVFRSRPVSVIREGDWKLIYNFEDNSVELYNIRKDIAEKLNLANSYPHKVATMEQKLKKWQIENKACILQAK